MDLFPLELINLRFRPEFKDGLTDPIGKLIGPLQLLKLEDKPNKEEQEPVLSSRPGPSTRRSPSPLIIRRPGPSKRRFPSPLIIHSSKPKKFPSPVLCPTFLRLAKITKSLLRPPLPFGTGTPS